MTYVQERIEITDCDGRVATVDAEGFYYTEEETNYGGWLDVTWAVVEKEPGMVITQDMVTDELEHYL